VTEQTDDVNDPVLSWLEEDRLHEECGVFGIFNHPDAAALTALGLHALQHRGQEAAGIVSFDGAHFHTERRVGLVGDHFTSRPVIERLKGDVAIGHVRYSTCGDPVLRNVQPLFVDLDSGGFALAHNGNLTNALTLRDWLIKKGAICQSTTDTEVILHLVARSEKRRFVEKFIEALLQVEGAYAFVGLTNKKLVGARDPYGIRPLVLGKLGEAWVLASETCALDIIGAEFVREVENGEVVVISREGIESHRFVPKYPARLCIFEYIYFARPDSIVGGRSVYEVRKEMGRQLAREAPADADVVVPIPDSGVPAAIGYSQESGLPFEYGIIRNHYVGRTFIEPEQRIRQLGVKLKHSANESQVKGKRIVLIDDSVVRGTTSVKIVQMMREAGAREVHMRISSPPITHPDFYGIDTPDQDKLLAANRTLEEIGRWATRAAIRLIPNSPTIASPANTRRGSETAKARRSRSSSPSSPRSVDRTSQGPHRAYHRRLARHRPGGRASLRARGRACAPPGPRADGAGRARRCDRRERRQGDAHPAQPDRRQESRCARAHPL
jgi:amidophosphoribosyltransferase